MLRDRYAKYASEIRIGECGRLKRAEEKPENKFKGLKRWILGLLGIAKQISSARSQFVMNVLLNKDMAMIMT
jgi:hypothetical protein